MHRLRDSLITQYRLALHLINVLEVSKSEESLCVCIHLRHAIASFAAAMGMFTTQFHCHSSNRPTDHSRNQVEEKKEKREKEKEIGTRKPFVPSLPFFFSRSLLRQLISWEKQWHTESVGVKGYQSVMHACQAYISASNCKTIKHWQNSFPSSPKLTFHATTYP